MIKPSVLESPTWRAPTTSSGDGFATKGNVLARTTPFVGQPLGLYVLLLLGWGTLLAHEICMHALRGQLCAIN